MADLPRYLIAATTRGVAKQPQLQEFMARIAVLSPAKLEALQSTLRQTRALVGRAKQGTSLEPYNWRIIAISDRLRFFREHISSIAIRSKQMIGTK